MGGDAPGLGVEGVVVVNVVIVPVPGGTVLPSPWPQADHDGKGQGGQEEKRPRYSRPSRPS